MALNLMDLPLEIRRNVYKCIFEDNVILMCCIKPRSLDCQENTVVAASCLPFKFHSDIAVTLTSKQFFAESLPEFLNHAYFNFDYFHQYEILRRSDSEHSVDEKQVLEKLRHVRKIISDDLCNAGLDEDVDPVLLAFGISSLPTRSLPRELIVYSNIDSFTFGLKDGAGADEIFVRRLKHAIHHPNDIHVALQVEHDIDNIPSQSSPISFSVVNQKVTLHKFPSVDKAKRYLINLWDILNLAESAKSLIEDLEKSMQSAETVISRPENGDANDSILETQDTTA